MPIKLPNLDDRTFADLVAEAHTLISVNAPEWTNHNESDPGITLIELFAYLTEMQIYRLNRVTDANLCAFLQLIDGIERRPSKQNRGMVQISKWIGKDKIDCLAEVPLRDEVRDVVLKLRQQDRAVTCEDFERLTLAATRKVSRAYCLARRDLTASHPYATADGHISVVIVAALVPFDAVLCFDGKDFSDLTHASDGDGPAISLSAATPSPDARLLLGSTTIFARAGFALSETGVGCALTFEYFNGKDWIKLNTEKDRLSDNTANWSASGFVSFTPPPDWTPVVVNNANAYWLRISTGTALTRTAAARTITRDLIAKDGQYGDLIAKVGKYLEPRRLLTTRVHVVPPRFVSIGVHVNLALKADAVPETVRQDAVNKLNQFLNPQVWPFGRNVYVSEIYRLLDRTPGVDFVAKITGTDIVTAHDVSDDRRIPKDAELVAISLNPDELVNFSLAQSDIVPLSQTERVEK